MKHSSLASFDARFDKKCGESGISENQKCTKTSTLSPIAKKAIGGLAVSASMFVILGLFLQYQKLKGNKQRQNKLKAIFEDKMSAYKGVSKGEVQRLWAKMEEAGGDNNRQASNKVFMDWFKAYKEKTKK